MALQLEIAWIYFQVKSTLLDPSLNQNTFPEDSPTGYGMRRQSDIVMSSRFLLSTTEPLLVQGRH